MSRIHHVLGAQLGIRVHHVHGAQTALHHVHGAQTDLEEATRQERCLCMSTNTRTPSHTQQHTHTATHTQTPTHAHTHDRPEITHTPNQPRNIIIKRHYGYKNKRKFQKRCTHTCACDTLNDTYKYRERERRATVADLCIFLCKSVSGVFMCLYCIEFQYLL